MPIKFHKKGSNGQSGGGDGIFIDVARITKVKPYHKSAPNEKMSPRDVGVEVFYKPVGKDLSFEPNVFVGGNLKRDDMGRVTDVGGAFKVQRLFERAGVEFELTDEETIPEELLRDLIGRTITVLSYRNTKTTSDKLKTTAWDIVGSEEESDSLKSYFLQQVDSGWVKNYVPDQVTSGNAAGLPFGDEPPF